ncbi:MAG: DHH family phosphoesterase [Desulfobacter sp.]|nr:DHH family phosphoesterase [Desulfobacter sp.]WDP85842.1 MAG: DHH family phosphoesterase [Desulfobacter sp.]
MLSNQERIKKMLALFSKTSKVLIVINADPDAIGSAMAVKRILWRRVSEVGIAYFNRISRPDNLAMINLTEPGMVPLDEVDASCFDRFVIVDSQPDHNSCFSRFSFDVIIDHHPLSSAEAPFSDVRPDYGACSSMVTEYLKTMKIKPSAKLAAALMLGIKTDTADFTRQAGSGDIRAFQHLYKFADMNIVTKVERALVTEADLDFLGQAIKKRKIIDNRAFFHAGNISKPDALVVVADFFLAIAGVNWSVISGVIEKKLIIILRNDGLRKGAGKTAQEAFGRFGSAGGHKTMARAELLVSLIRKEIKKVNQNALAKWVQDSITLTAGKKIE